MLNIIWLFKPNFASNHAGHHQIAITLFCTFQFRTRLVMRWFTIVCDYPKTLPHEFFAESIIRWLTNPIVCRAASFPDKIPLSSCSVCALACNAQTMSTKNNTSRLFTLILFYVTDKREKYCKCYGINDKFHPILNVTTQHPHCYAYNQTDKCKEHEI